MCSDIIYLVGTLAGVLIGGLCALLVIWVDRKGR